MTNLMRKGWKYKGILNYFSVIFIYFLKIMTHFCTRNKDSNEDSKNYYLKTYFCVKSPMSLAFYKCQTS